MTMVMHMEDGATRWIGQQLRAVIETRGAVDLVVGNGIDYMPYPDLSLTPPSEVWSRWEAWRFVTANQLPVQAYAYLSSLIVRPSACCRRVVTSNYDMFWNSILDASNVPFAQNPCRVDGDPKSAFYSSPDADSVELWKPHGDLGCAWFECCGHTERLPGFLIGWMDTADDGSSDSLNERLTEIGGADRFAGHFMLREDGALRCDSHSSVARRHFHDRNAPAGLFERWQTAASDAILKSDAQMILIVGFKGDEQGHLSKAVVEAARRGKSVVMLYRPSVGRDEAAYPLLWRELKAHQPLSCCDLPVLEGLHQVLTIADDSELWNRLLARWHLSGLFRTGGIR